VHSKQGRTQENEDAAVEDDSLQDSWLEIPDGSHQNATHTKNIVIFFA
jgi:hypothetical protein